MGAVKKAFHDEILEEAHRRDEAGVPDEPRTYVLCPDCLGARRNNPCATCDGTFHVPEDRP